MAALIMLNVSEGFAQDDYIYAKGTFDPSNAFGIIDNPRTKVESIGFDYDVEFGFRHLWLGGHAFFGAFPEINYKNYGAGIDFYPDWFNETFDLSVGIYSGVILRKGYGYNNEDVWGTFIAPGLRGITTVWIFDNVGLTATAQLQHRPDIGKLAIFDGHFGIIIRRHNSNKSFR